jgi:hypothetical protein
MSWLLFMDESGHDHKVMPYEVRGGVALHAGNLWAFVQGMRRLELDCFGCVLHEFRCELKGSTLLDKKRFGFAAQSAPMDADVRRKYSRAFLTKGLEKKVPNSREFAAYGQACLEMARGIFQLLNQNHAVLFAAAIPRGSNRDATAPAEYLRKDQVFLLERYFYFLEAAREFGLIVVDEVEKVADRKFVRQLEAYFTRSAAGRERTVWIVPSPFFVASDMIYPMQAADLCIYCINWGFRLPTQGMNEPVRTEIAEEFGPWLSRLPFRGQGYRDGNVFDSFGICFVSNPVGPGRA